MEITVSDVRLLISDQQRLIFLKIIFPKFLHFLKLKRYIIINSYQQYFLFKVSLPNCNVLFCELVLAFSCVVGVIFGKLGNTIKGDRCFCSI